MLVSLFLFFKIMINQCPFLSVVAGNAMTTWLSQTNLPALTLSYILLGACVCLGLDYPDLPTSTSGILVNSSSVPNLQWSQVYARSGMNTLCRAVCIATHVEKV